jgi:hypothetical protein
MPILTNDRFHFEKKEFRLLSIHAARDIAVVIDMESYKANPVTLKYSEIQSSPLIPENALETLRKVSDKQKEHAEIMLEAIGHFKADWPAMADETYRAQRIADVSKATGYSRQTLYKQARRYWQGGQVVSALYPDFNRCGRVSHAKLVVVDITSGTETDKNENGETAAITVSAGGFALKPSDLAKILKALNDHFLRLNGHTLQETVLRLHDEHYSTPSPAGVPIPAPKGAKPSYHQVYRFLKSAFTADQIAIARDGETAFNKNRRGTTGTERDVTAGPGDIYDVDAYLCDIYVTCEDRVYTAGRPILYLLRDKDTGLYVGMYIGMEKPSWLGAVMAVLSIFEDKELLCLRHGIQYSAEDWPAHGLLPTQIAGDRGEAAAKASGSLGENLGVAVSLYPGGRPDAKGGLEKSFNTTRLYFQTLESGYVVPDSTHMEHVGKVGAAIKFSEFEKKMWEKFISHNNLVNTSARTSRSEILHKILATPINLWNHRHPQNPSLVRRNSFNQVKLALLPRGPATITSEGFIFEHRVYKNDEAFKLGAFSKHKGVENIKVIYDPRSVNVIWALMPNGQIYESKLSSLSKEYLDLTRQEAHDLFTLKKEIKGHAEEHNLLVKAQLRHSAAILRKHVKAEKAKGPKISRNAKVKNMAATGDHVRKASDAERLAVEGLHAPAANVIPSSSKESATQDAPTKPALSHMEQLIQAALGKIL